MIRILLVEDKESAATKFRARIGRTSIHAEIAVAASRDSALGMLSEREFDLLVCDLSIPTVDKGLEVDEAYGWYVVEAARSVSPGMPIVVLSAFINLAKAQQWLALSRPDVFGDGSNIPSNTAFNKEDGDAVIDAIAAVADELDRIDVMPLDFEITANLDPIDERLIRLYGLQRGAVRVVVEHQYAGYSGSSVVQVRLINERGRVFEVAVVKCSETVKLTAETQGYDHHVSHMTPGQIAHVIARVTGGVPKKGAVAYALADGHRTNVYESLPLSPERAKAVIDGLVAIQARWTEAAYEDRVKIREIRRALCPDGRLEKIIDLLADIPWQQFEDRVVPVMKAVQFRDLHAGNVLVNAGAQPLVIDYTDVGDAVHGLDAVTFELSLLLQEPARAARGGWPTVEQVGSWSSLETYLLNCPYSALLEMARAWALSAAGSSHALVALAYAYAVRQLLFDDTDHELALALIKALAASDPGST